MDPNKTLANIRAIIRKVDSRDTPRVNTPEYPDSVTETLDDPSTIDGFNNLVDELVETVDVLDQWLTKGGFLPAEWNHSSRHGM